MDSFDSVPPPAKWTIPLIIRIKATDEKLIGIEYIFPESRKSFDSIGKVNSENLIIQRVCGYLMDYFTKGSIDHEKIWAEFHFDEILPTEFTRKVLHRTSQIPFGSKMTYGEIGIAIDSKGYQAIGSVLAHNPFPLLIPCQRVVGQKSLGGFMGKTASDSLELNLKSALLGFERLQI